ncbi:hypothetical protein [Rhodopila globiformis]|uniref:hypothetical protein n=1 Tax=Rhodopila globiformis TaxID=1071 RepID=UPI0011B08702|nr:hypothetical protein [Rhodopila globiformis]
MMVCDIGGSQKEQPFETFGFLIFDLDCNPHWLNGQAAFRRNALIQRRRMAFKALNDGLRRRSLVPFLTLAEVLNGVLVTFAVHKVDRPIMGDGGATHEELAPLWKPAVINRLMWVIYLGAFLVSGFSPVGQDVMFIINEDEIAANVPQLTKLTDLFARAVSNQQGPMRGHLRCGTTKSDDGSLALEDLAALPDLTAGAVAEFVAALALKGAGPLSPLLQKLPSGVSWKTRQIIPWALASGGSLERFVCLIDSVPGSQKWRATIPRWFTVPDLIKSGSLLQTA